MGTCLYHAQCPNCASVGKDLSGDNLGVYDDGSTYCFGCGLYTPGDGRATKRPEKPVYQLQLIDNIPEENLTYLRQYLSDSEIENWFQYEPNMRRHVFYYNGEDGVFWEARAVGNITPKSIQNGKKPFYPLFNLEDETNTLVIVEDLISAICVSRHLSALPLFGSSMRMEWIARVTQPNFCSRIFVWLDEDKTREAISIANRINPLKPCFVIRTQEDPKSLTEEEMKDVLENPGLYFNELQGIP